MDARLEEWAASGAMALTGRADRAPLGPPAPLVGMLVAAAGALARHSAAGGRQVLLDPLALLGERAALAGLGRRSPISCGGGTRLLAAADGMIAVTLARPDDLTLVPAWLELPADGPARGDGTDIEVVDDVSRPEGQPDGRLEGAFAWHRSEELWASIALAVSTRPVAWIEARAALVGLAVAARSSAELVAPTPIPADPSPIAHLVAPPHRASRPIDVGVALVVDLSALWAGPLCGQLLGAAGARVVKVESTTRPDGARWGPAAFFDLLNGTKESVALDLREASSRAALARLIRAADVVIESSRPRALEQLGIRAEELLADEDGPTVWVSITGYGRSGAGADRIAYGDVAAVAGGLVVDDQNGPCFCADAVADPCTGLVAAVAALEALAAGTPCLLDVALVAVAARGAGPQLSGPAGVPLAVAPPRARPSIQSAPPLGADTERVLDGLPR